MTQTLDSATTQQGQTFSGTVATDVMADGLVAIRQGTGVTGRVSAVQEAAHYKGNSLLTVELVSINRHGDSIAVSTQPYSVEGKGRGKNTAAISPVALEAVRRIDALFDIERGINGIAADERMRIRKEQSAPLLIELEAWLRDERGRLSRSASVAQPIDYMLKRWDRFARFRDDGRVCLTNNAAERALRGFALGRKSWLFAGSERGADRAAAMAMLITTAKLNDVDPLAWLADVLSRIAEHPVQRLDELLPWNWRKTTDPKKVAA